MANNLGRLTPVELRDHWKDEAQDFTRWLAEPENLNLLGETLGIGLEPTETEAKVGPYRADIVARRVGGDERIVIENQLEKTNHDHLGKLLTYAAALNATTVVWIAREFTEEHRQAMDWLNNLATTRLQLFAVEVKLWRIGSSSVAPQFQIVSEPNDYVRALREEESAELGEVPSLYLRFWTQFTDYLRTTHSLLRPPRPSPRAWLSFSIGKRYFDISLNLSVRNQELGCELNIRGPNGNKAFELLSEQKDKIELELGELNWDSRETGKSWSVNGYRPNEDITDPDKWPEYFAWLKERAEGFQRVFSSRVKELD